MKRIYTRDPECVWELVSSCNLNADSNGDVWGELYRYPIYTGVQSGETVVDGCSSHTAPKGGALYTLWKYVQDACLMGYRWEAEA